MVKVKVCGIKRFEDLKACIEAEVDAVGFILGFPQSPRNLSFEEAKDLLDKLPPFISGVAVIREERDLIEKVIKNLNPDALQLYGSFKIKEYKDMVRGLKLIKVLEAKEDSLEKAKVALSLGYQAILLDSLTHGMGGTGKIHDWNRSRRIRDEIYPHPFILAGGLNKDNVLEAIEKVKPYAVDASSGLEVKRGIKDPELIKEFVRVVKG
ncbi:N-(5'-phosphoribosyl)anthranilate isomerase [archaeon HR06]|nr:N-(5'-phosphoribosyl)anthranilate isomerase [archaeon HR06]